MGYRYEDLAPESFQTLCQALLVRQYPNVTCMPVRQADGGRDAVIDHANSDRAQIVFQVKWSSRMSPSKGLVSWLEDALKGEQENVERMAKDGLERFVLMTNATASAAPQVGSRDRLTRLLGEYSDKWGVKVECWLRPDIDALLDSAPVELKMTYADMLTGKDAIVAMLAAAPVRPEFERARRLVKMLCASQAVDARQLRFKQAGLRGAPIEQMYVDPPYVVEATRGPEASDTGTALSLVRGHHAGCQDLFIFAGPGHGKSTLLQFVCQAHRSEILGDSEFFESTDRAYRPIRPRVPFAVTFPDIAEWLANRDPFAVGGTARVVERARRRTLESLMCHLIEVHVGEDTVSLEDLHQVAQRFPLLFALDGLDEIADETARAQTVQEVERSIARLRALEPEVDLQVLIAGRPAFGRLSEPDKARFDRVELAALPPKLRRQYLNNWCSAQQLSTQDRKELESTYELSSRLPHVSDLGRNAMQLSILLYLMYQRSESLPAERTELYQSYMLIFLDRESQKDRVVRAHRQTLEDVTGFLGWTFHCRAESGVTQASMTVEEIKAGIVAYLYRGGKDTGLVDPLFNAMRERIWVITSRIQGTFQFEVQPIQEFFAARFLAQTAPEAGRTGVDKLDRFARIATRPFWFNVARFLAGFMTQGELFGLADRLDRLANERTGDLLLRRLGLQLLADRVFAREPRAAIIAATAVMDNIGIRVLASGLGHGFEETGFVHPRDEVAFQHAREIITRNPGNGLAVDLCRFLGRSDPAFRFADWVHAQAAAAESVSRRQWLGHLSHVGLAGAVIDPDGLAGLAANSHELAWLLAGGLTPRSEHVESALLDCLRDGSVVPFGASGGSKAAALWSVASVDAILGWAFGVNGVDPDPRSEATKSTNFKKGRRLLKADPAYHDLLGAFAPKAGDFVSSTRGWLEVARRLNALLGSNWLSIELAVFAAARSSLVTGGDFSGAEVAYTATVDPRALVRDARKFRATPAWWSEARSTATGEASVCAWLMSLLAVADAQVVSALRQDITRDMDAMSEAAIVRLVAFLSRLPQRGAPRKLGVNLATEAIRDIPIVGSLMRIQERQAAISEGLDETGVVVELYGLAPGAAMAQALEPAIFARTVGRSARREAALRSDEFAVVAEKFGVRRALASPGLGLAKYEVGEVLHAPESFPYPVVKQALESPRDQDRPFEVSVREESKRDAWFALASGD